MDIHPDDFGPADTPEKLLGQAIRASERTVASTEKYIAEYEGLIAEARQTIAYETERQAAFAAALAQLGASPVKV